VSEAIRTHLPCPSCDSSDAYSEYSDGHGFCFSCSEYFPAGESINDKYTMQSMPEWRGISSSSFRFYGVKAKVDGTGAIKSVGFPYPDGAFKVRLYGEKGFYSVGQPKGLFGREKFTPGCNTSIIITEGELDAISCWQVSGIPSVSVRSASSGFGDAREEVPFLDSFQRIYLAFDSDEPGEALARRVARLFDYNKVYAVRMAPRKDANDFLQAGLADELATVIRHSKRWVPDTIVSSFSDFKKILEEETKPGVEYPFPTLTEMTYGLRTGETVLITAQEGIGKTELMHAIEYQLLTKTSDPVAAFFLEEPKKRHLQAIAGLHLRTPVHLPDSTKTTTEIHQALEEAVESDDRLHIYSHFGSDDPDRLLETVRFVVSARGCRWVLVDHISMVLSGVPGLEDERRKLDYISTQLQMMVKELDFGLIIVSHVNDYGQTRGSRYIGKIADIRIDVERDPNNPDDLVRNTSTLRVTKNRFSGRTGLAGRLYFDPKTFTYSELMEAKNDNDVGRPVLLAVG
jgi:twinkle protein